MKLNTIYNEDCVEGIRKHIPDNSIDLTVTSPPYDDLRDYKGYKWSFRHFKKLAKELYRVTKDGGVVVWIVADKTENGSETGTSFKQALYFKKIGFNLHDTMIYAKKNPIPLTHNRYEQQFEYMFVLSKGKPKKFNPIKEDCKTAGNIHDFRKRLTSRKRNREAIRIRKEKYKTKNTKYKTNIWYYKIGSNQSAKDKEAFKHPAIFPEQLAKDHIISWSNPGDIVLDPFMGSGTTAKMALATCRKFVGFEISEEYCWIAYKRIGMFDKKYYEKLPEEEKPRQQQLF